MPQKYRYIPDWAMSPPVNANSSNNPSSIFIPRGAPVLSLRHEELRDAYESKNWSLLDKLASKFYPNLTNGSVIYIDTTTSKDDSIKEDFLRARELERLVSGCSVDARD